VKETGRTSKKINFSQGPTHPAVANWDDSTEFCAWLTERERKAGKLGAAEEYRLPGDHEWSCAVGIGGQEDPDQTPTQKKGRIKDVFPWGMAWPPPPEAGNLAGRELHPLVGKHEGIYEKSIVVDFEDQFVFTAPVGSFAPNTYALYDLSGNMWEWCMDWFDEQKKARTQRGCSWSNSNSPFDGYRSSQRNSCPPRVDIWQSSGFRCVLAPVAVATPPATTTVSPSPNLPVSSSSSSATKDAPFVNTLGMKFVPVPIIGGPTDGQRVLFSIWETRVEDYEAFVKETGRGMRVPPFKQGPTHPVTGMNWGDAQFFCSWLTDRERKVGKISTKEMYRLPSDHEWSCAVGIGDREDPAQLPGKKKGKIEFVYPWGRSWPPPARIGNLAGMELATALASGTVKVMSTRAQLPIPNYQDGFEATAAVGSFPTNLLGLFDLEGNVLEWCEDKYEASPKDDGVMRGGCWGSGSEAQLYLSSHRQIYPRNIGFHFYNGFRVVLAPVAAASAPATTTVSPSPSLPVSSSTVATATKDAPFVNTLGMKFVSVPGTKVLFSIWETRVRDYSSFARSNKVDDAWTSRQRNGIPVGRDRDHPAVAVNWEEAQAFCRWLTDKEAKDAKLPKGWLYRLPKDEEWSLAVEMPPEQGQTPAEKSRMNRALFPWGSSFPPPNAKIDNYADTEWHEKFPTDSWLAGYTDGYATTAPVGSFPVNVHGLHDLGGNVWEWCEDLLTGQGTKRVLRGGCWGNSSSDDLTSACRYFFGDPETHVHAYGFRCVLQTGP